MPVARSFSSADNPEITLTVVFLYTRKRKKKTAHPSLFNGVELNQSNRIKALVGLAGIAY